MTINEVVKRLNDKHKEDKYFVSAKKHADSIIIITHKPNPRKARCHVSDSRYNGYFLRYEYTD